MVRTLVFHAVRMRWRAIVVWGLALGGLGALVVGIYPSFGADLNEMLDQYPQGLLDFMGTNNASSIEGFLALELFSMFVPLLLAGYAITVGAQSLAGAEERGTLDVLLSNPVSRRRLVVSSYLTVVCAVTLVAALLGAIIWVAALIVSVGLSFWSLVAGVANLIPLCLFFGGFALLVSAFLHTATLPIAIPVGVLVAMYFLDAMANISETVEPFRVASVFHYYGSAVENGIDWLPFVVLLLVSALFAAIASEVFDRRDLYT
jgi:ABC-2 type transport system permease protein